MIELLIIVFLILLIILYKSYLKEGFYLSFFPYCENKSRNDMNIMRDTNKKADLVSFKDKEITFKFPKNTTREQMISYIGYFFKSKINGMYKNTLFIKFERIGEGSSDFYPINLKKMKNSDYTNVNLIIGYNDTIKYKYSNYGTSNRTKYITSPQTNKIIKYPLEFKEDIVRIRIDRKVTPIPILYFMHYYFDDFYCKGKMESKTFNVSGTNMKDSISKYVVEVGDIKDCKWGGIYSKIQSFENKKCKIYNDIELEPDTISVEPDNVISNYKTPSKKLNRCNVKSIYFKKWDGRGVPIEYEDKNIKMKEYIPHPSLFQNKLDGLYDDLFDMSRIIPSYPTGRNSVGR